MAGEMTMLQEFDSHRTRATCKVHCKKCCRKEYHFLNVRGTVNRFFVKLLTLGLVGFVGQYRCVCCGTARIGRFDIIRGRQPRSSTFKATMWNPLNWWFDRRDSWDGIKRRKKLTGWVFGNSRHKKYRHKPFRKKFW